MIKNLKIKYNNRTKTFTYYIVRKNNNHANIAFFIYFE